jgi:hypothetical protein
MLGDLIVLFGLGCLVLSPFAFFQVITKAGYSGWWTFVPYSPWIVGIVGALAVGTTRTIDSSQSFEATLNQLWLWDLLMFVTGVFVMVMFFIFAFSAWPALQARRPSQGFQPGSPRVRSGQPSWINAPAPVASSPYGAPAAPPPGQQQAQASGWHRTGAVGSGEQGYWDGLSWTARRQWKDGAWVDLPMVAAGPGEAGTVEAS